MQLRRWWSPSLVVDDGALWLAGGVQLGQQLLAHTDVSSQGLPAKQKATHASSGVNLGRPDVLLGFPGTCVSGASAHWQCSSALRADMLTH